jgi:hypothetical protein
MSLSSLIGNAAIGDAGLLSNPCLEGLDIVNAIGALMLYYLPPIKVLVAVGSTAGIRKSSSRPLPVPLISLLGSSNSSLLNRTLVDLTTLFRAGI